MLKTELLHNMDAFVRLADEWDALAGRGMTDTPFQTWAYQRAWWRHLGPSDLQTLAVRRETGELVGIASLYLVDGVIYFNGCVEETDYLDLITTAAAAEEVWTAVLDCLHSDEFPAWRAMDLCNVPADSPTRTILPQLAARRGLSFATQVHEVCPVIELPATFDAYLDSLDKKQRHELRRKLRRAEGAEVQIYTVGPDADLTAEVDDFLALLQKSTPEKHAWLNDARRAVFQEAAAAGLAAKTLQLLFLRIEGQKAATLFNFAYKNRIWVYNSGLDPDNFSWLSAGVVLTARAIEQGIEQGYTTFDFLRGNEEYKYRFGAKDTLIYRLHLQKD